MRLLVTSLEARRLRELGGYLKETKVAAIDFLIEHFASDSNASNASIAVLKEINFGGFCICACSVSVLSVTVNPVINYILGGVLPRMPCLIDLRLRLHKSYKVQAMAAVQQCKNLKHLEYCCARAPRALVLPPPLESLVLRAVDLGAMVQKGFQFPKGLRRLKIVRPRRVLPYAAMGALLLDELLVTYTRDQIVGACEVADILTASPRKLMLKGTFCGLKCSCGRCQSTISSSRVEVLVIKARKPAAQARCTYAVLSEAEILSLYDRCPKLQKLVVHNTFIEPDVCERYSARGLQAISEE